MDPVVEGSRDVIRKGSKSFAAAARLFDQQTRHDVYLLYAWCRHCDDEIDGQELGFASEAGPDPGDPERLERIRTLTRHVLDGGQTNMQPFKGLQRVVHRHRIPPRYPLELIDGFEMDVAGHRYRDLEDTLLYSYHVAGVVGVMMAYVMGVREPSVLSRAADLGIAFQLTNISRDVLDDAANGRVYLPESWLTEAGISPATISDDGCRDAVAQVVHRLLEVADRYYESAAQGVRALPFRAAWAISTASGVYRDIGEVVRARGARAWDQRAFVPTGRKLYWVIRGGLRAMGALVLDRRRMAIPRDADLWIKPDLC